MYLCNSQNQCKQNYSLILTFIRKKVWPCLVKGETSGDATSGHLGFSRLTDFEQRENYLNLKGHWYAILLMTHFYSFLHERKMSILNRVLPALAQNQHIRNFHV